jgi:hypothetical protein
VTSKVEVEHGVCLAILEMYCRTAVLVGSK